MIKRAKRLFIPPGRSRKRDHRKLAKALNFFHTQEEAPGMVFWHEKGWTIYQQVEQYIRDKLRLHGYGEVKHRSW